METQDNSLKKQVFFSIEGIEGKAEEGSISWNFHGDFASHTGFSSVMEKLDDIEAVKKTACDLYNKQAGLCYLIGDEHREFGWKPICIDYDGKIRIRLPCWADIAIKKALIKIGMFETCDINRFWSFEKSVDLKDAREALKPLLEKNTRFSDQKKLAERVLKSYAYSSLAADEMQLSFF